MYRSVFAVAILPVLCACGSASAQPTPTPSLTSTTTPSFVHSASSASVRFGQGFKHGKLVHPGTKFSLKKSVAWAATFSKAAGVSRVSEALVQTSGPGPHPKTVWTGRPSVGKSSKSLTGSLNPKQLKHLASAKYELELVAGNRTLAWGKFDWLSCTTCGGPGGGY